MLSLEKKQDFEGAGWVDGPPARADGTRGVGLGRGNGPERAEDPDNSLGEIVRTTEEVTNYEVRKMPLGGRKEKTAET